ncbi:hypothetical protein M0802_012723 [Mischocyttarus mexicanus]|nr:hypothetical protein M0802_012723 [Mischocyttarus mexicanus]
MSSETNNPDLLLERDEEKQGYSDADSDRSHESSPAHSGSEILETLGTDSKTKEAMADTYKEMRETQLILMKTLININEQLDKIGQPVSSSQDSQSKERHGETTKTTLTHAEAGTSKEDRITGISQEQLIGLMEEVVKRSGSLNSSNKPTSAGSGSNAAQDMSEKMLVQIIRHEPARRQYTLTSQMRLDHFMDYLTSELRSLDLLYVIDPKEKTNHEIDEATKQNHKYSVRDIIINRLDQNYYSKISEITDPVEILNKIREIKRCESNLAPLTIRQRLYNMRYVPYKETAAQFWDRFEELVRNYNAISNEAPLTEEEKRDLAYNAVVRVTPDLRSVNFITQGSTGNRLKYDRIKALVVQQEAEKSMDLKVEPTAFHTKRQDSRKRSYSYNDRSYHGGESSNSSRITCYGCGKPGHIRRNCQTRPKQYHQRSSSKYSSSRQPT